MFIFHDVDLISPKEIIKVYKFVSKIPLHIASFWTEKYNFDDFFGGIVSFKGSVFEQINGFPNLFYGWGGEDDAVYNRLVANKIPFYKFKSNKNITIFEMKHVQTSTISDLTNEQRKQNILNDFKNWQNDGLNNVKFNIDKKMKSKYYNVKKYIVSILN
jgi:hypothetical protein